MSQLKNILKNGQYMAKNLQPKFNRLDKIPKTVLSEINKYKKHVNHIPAIINGNEFNTFSYNHIVSPFDNKYLICKNHDLSKDYLITENNELGKIQILKAQGQKCDRCWHYQKETFKGMEDTKLCERCANIISL